jgi:hypothetical protein
MYCVTNQKRYTFCEFYLCVSQLDDGLNESWHLVHRPGWTGVKPSITRCADGLLSWDAWPPHSDLIVSNDTSPHDDITSQEKMHFPDKAFIASAQAMGKTYASSVSPVFFKHLSDAPSDNLIYRSDDWMMINRYTKLIQQEPKPHFIQ